MRSARQKQATVCLFAKAPRVGEAKTRLIPALGAQGAAALSRALLLDALDSWASSSASLLVAQVGEMDDELATRIACYPCVSQETGDLGERMECGLRAALARTEIALVVGTDSPGLGEKQLRQTLDLLESHDAVLGPVEDGGFALLALRECPAGLLAELPWSCDTTAVSTYRRLRAAGMSVAWLPMGVDIDRPSDLCTLATYLRANPAQMCHTRAFFSSKDNRAISVIIPVLDEEVRLPRLLHQLSSGDDFAEIIVVDGGSCDRSVAIATDCGVRVVHTGANRAEQMNCGAEEAIGGTLLFLHADAQLPRSAASLIRNALYSEDSLAGAFRLCTRYDHQARPRPWIRSWLWLADIRSYYSGVPYGDQAIFVRARTFWQLGGFPVMPLFEDLAFSRALRALSPLTIISKSIRVSGRRFQERPIYYFALMNTFPVLFHLGVPCHWLSRFYHTTR